MTASRKGISLAGITDHFSVSTGLILVSLAAASALAWAWLPSAGRTERMHWRSPAPVIPDISIPASEPDGATAGSDTMSTAYLMAQMQERPLFRIDRRPYVPPPPPPPVAKEEPPPRDSWSTAKLTGLFQGDVSGAIVLLDGKERRMRLGDTIEGWRLERIEPRRLVIVRGAQQRDIELKRAVLTDAPPSAASVRRPVIVPAQGASAAAPSAAPPSTARTNGPPAPPASSGAASEIGFGGTK